MVEFQPSKLAVVGSNPIARSSEDVKRETLVVKRKPGRRHRMLTKDASRKKSAARRSREAHVAQLVEHVLGKDEVTRSIRVVGSKRSSLDPERFS